MIDVNIDINKDKLEEFIRLLLPEIYGILTGGSNSNKDILINVDEKNDIISVESVLLKKSGKDFEGKEGSERGLEKIERKVTFSYGKVSPKYSDQAEVMVKTSLLKLFQKEKAYKWGALVGVRPTKIVRRFLKMGLSFEKIAAVLRDIYFVSEVKIELLLDIVKREMKYLDKETIGIYIGISFCPTKCTYCSFPAYLLKGKYGERYEEYLEGLYRETAETGRLVKELNLKIDTIYVGGGTPSILSEGEIERLLLTVKENYDLRFLREFTFEAGRIDTLNRKKLEIMKRYGVNKISINPQSFNERTLKKVNRYHDRKEFDDIYEAAKEEGIEVNMDLILGLPGETTEDIMYTLRETGKYDPENLTIHNLAIKNASSLNKEKYVHEDVLDYERIYGKIEEIASSKKLYPYYMYRQKNSFQWGENLGYSKEGSESVYNMEMIEENKIIIGVGAGAVTKLIWEDEKREHIRRIVNPKDPLVWLYELDERLKNKREKIEELVSGKYESDTCE